MMGEGSGPGTDYAVTVTLLGERDVVRMELTVVDEDDPGKKSSTIDLALVKTAPYKRDDPTQAGTQLVTNLSLPRGFKPGVIILNKQSEPDSRSESPICVALIELKDVNSDALPVIYSAYTYVDLSQSDRWIFPATTPLPGFEGYTPAGLLYYRNKELEALRGTEKDLETTRTGSQRVYQYDVYNDLGNPDPKTPEQHRSVLGGSHLKYPRRLRTGRPAVGVYESPIPKEKVPWLPLDERFNSVKFRAFSGDRKSNEVRMLRSIMGTPLGLSFALAMVPVINKMVKKSPQQGFGSFSVVDALYDGLCSRNKQQTEQLLPRSKLQANDMLNMLKQRWHSMDAGLRKALGLAVPAHDIDDIMTQKLSPEKLKQAEANHDAALDNLEEGGIHDGVVSKLQDLLDTVDGVLEKFPVPAVRAGRNYQWRTDEEFGCAALMGQNPLSIRAVTEEDMEAFTIKDADLGTLLGNKRMDERWKEGRLWVLDVHSAYAKFLHSDFGELKNVLHAGRCLFFTRDDEATVPVAIELESAGSPMRVFTPNSRQEVWALAKTIVSSLDSGIHQLVQHWLRTHACMEPYIIATRRELSILNPVYKLLQPHFRYTMRINCNARQALISAGGLVELTFTPGRYSMEISSHAYESWEFKDQSLPGDLLKRRVAVENDDGSLHIKIPHYRYAQDGLLLWNAIKDFVEEYLRLYYDDTLPGKHVTDDKEVMAWWNSIQKEGHPDIKDGWPEIVNVASLRDVLSSIIWTASCHHAAVNFGQYDNAGYMPYKPSKIVGTIPAAGSDDEAALFDRFEETLLDTITPPQETLAIMMTVKILSSHASDEQYVTDEEHRFIKEERAAEVHRKFVKALAAVEHQIDLQNQAGQPHNAAPYTLLLPSNPPPNPKDSKARRPSRGIPMSISI